MVAETITDRVMQPRLVGTIYLAPEQVFVYSSLHLPFTLPFSEIYVGHW